MPETCKDRRLLRMPPLGRWIHQIGYGFNSVAAGAIVIMMLLTCADVVLRLFGHPILGTYEMVGFLGTVIIAFALAYTSIERGHIAVEILMDRLPAKIQSIVEGFNNLIGAGLFLLIAWQSSIYAWDLKTSGEVSLTLAIPTYPFVYGIAAGCALLALVLTAESLSSFRRAARK
jgi:TRAP-type C4-dicarboxylate transport system permease small subunit